MSVTNTETEALKRDLQKAQDDLKLLYFELGRNAAPWHKAIAYEPSREVFEKLCEVAQQSQNIENRVLAVKTALKNVSNSDNEIKETKLNISDLEKRILILKSSIGAVAVETYKAGRLPQELEKYLLDVRTYQSKEQEIADKRDTAKGLGKLFLQSQIKKFNEDLNSYYSQIGQNLFEDNKAELLQSDRAHTLVAEMKEILRMKEIFSANIKKHKDAIDKANNSLEKMGILGEEKTRLKNLESQAVEIKEKLNDAYKVYGEILAGNIDSWLDDMAPEELKTPCRQIKDQKNHIRELMLNIKLLNSQKEIEFHQAQTEQLAAQLNHLNTQLALIERQKTDIQIKIEEEKKALEELAKRQNDINALY